MFSNIPFAESENTSIFLPTSWYQTWYKPKGIKFVNIICIGGGGGGGRGVNASTAGGGGGGGCVSLALYAASTIPDTLAVVAGNPGPGATTSGGTGTTGGASFVLLNSSLTTLANSGLCNANGGLGASGATAAIARTASTISSSPYISMALQYTLLNGTAGSAGAAVAALTSQITCGGAGGGGSTLAGYNVTGAGLLPTLSGGAAGTSTGTNGASGVWLWKPLCSTGGSGGGAASAGTGGLGGNGAYGCGGGGGGFGSTAGGNGGRGGDGLVIITCW